MYRKVSRLTVVGVADMRGAILFQLAQGFGGEVDADGDAVTWFAFEGEVATGDGEEGTVGEQTTTGTGGGGIGREKPYTIVGDDHFQAGFFAVAGGFEGEA